MSDSMHRLNVWRTFARAVRTAWDALGFTCAVSLTLFVPCALLAAAAALPTGLRVIAGIAVYALVVAPMLAGACRLAGRIAARDEASYFDLWRGAFVMYGRAAALAAVQGMVAAALAADAVLLSRFGGMGGIIGAVVMAYALLLWGMCSVYHWPLLIAGDEGILQRDGGGRPGLASLLRNSFVMAIGAPGFTLVILVAIMALVPLLTMTGIGIALLGGGFVAHLVMQAGRDQLVRFGALPPPPDVDSPVQDVPWRIQ